MIIIKVSCQNSLDSDQARHLSVLFWSKTVCKVYQQMATGTLDLPLPHLEACLTYPGSSWLMSSALAACFAAKVNFFSFICNILD